MSPLAASLGPSTYWYLARATGAVALALLTLAVVLGILGPLRISGGRRWPRFAIDLMHRDVSLLVIVLLVLHIATSVLDGFAPIGWLDGINPFGAAYRPLWMGLGAFSFDLLLAIVVTSLLRVRLGYGSWRAVHWLAYLSWPVAVLHGLGTGTDVKTWWMLMLTFASLAAVVTAVLVRVARSRPEHDGVRAGASALAVITPLGIAIFTLSGPLASGWARRAGTPASLLPPAPAVSAASATASRQSAPAATAALRHPFTATLSGTVSQSQQAAGAVIELNLHLHGGVQGVMRVRLGGAPLEGGGLSLTGSQVDLSAVGQPTALDGRIVSLEGSRFLARVSDGSSTTLDLRANLNISTDGSSVTGTLSGQPTGAGG